MTSRLAVAALLTVALSGLSAVAAAQDKTPVTIKTAPQTTAASGEDAEKERDDRVKAEFEVKLKEVAEQRAVEIRANADGLTKLSQEVKAQQAADEEQRKVLASYEERLKALEARLTEEAGADEKHPFDITFSGFIRTLYQSVQDDPERTDFVGLNDGFVLSDARLAVDGTFEDYAFRLQFDGAFASPDSLNTSRFRLQTQLQDGWVAWRPSRWIQLQLGRFKPAFDGEELRLLNKMFFVTRSVHNRGVQGVEGINVAGMRQTRQVGLMLHSDRLMDSTDTLGGAWFVTVANGNNTNLGSNIAGSHLNDNDSPAVYGRLEFYYRDWVTLGVGAFYNLRTTNITPDLIDEEDIGLNVDLEFDAYDVVGGVQYTQINTTFPDVAVENDRNAWGYHAWLGYRLPMGFIPAVRYAFYDPIAEYTSSDSVINSQLQSDELTYVTPSLSWDAPRVPLRLQANYTFTLEGSGRELDNDRLDLLAQLSF